MNHEREADNMTAAPTVLPPRARGHSCWPEEPATAIEPDRSPRRASAPYQARFISRKMSNKITAPMKASMICSDKMPPTNGKPICGSSQPPMTEPTIPTIMSPISQIRHP